MIRGRIILNPTVEVVVGVTEKAAQLAGESGVVLAEVLGEREVA